MSKTSAKRPSSEILDNDQDLDVDQEFDLEDDLDHSESLSARLKVVTTDEPEPGGLLQDLDKRQDDVLNQLDDLQAKIDSVLAEMGITSQDDIELGDEFDE